MAIKKIEYLIICILIIGIVGIGLYSILSNYENIKHFEGSNISFDYPKTWSFGGYTDNIVVAQNDNPMASLSMRLHFAAPGTLDSSRQAALYEAKELKTPVLIDKTIEIDGEKAIYIATKSNDGFEYATIIFYKNGKEYDFMFAAKNITEIESDINTITNSFHIKTEDENGLWEFLSSLFN
ncbi:hypothetical protein [Methanobacterium sp. ACI-7]|uniref:hypothetical protein n=1 Tax=unclassified Methanobacterium TaxID=2627676 RepID=UPI0039C11357